MNQAEVTELQTAVAKVADLVSAIKADAPVSTEPTVPSVPVTPGDGIAELTAKYEAALAEKDATLVANLSAYSEKLAMIAAKYEELRVVDNNAETGFADVLAQAKI